MDVEKVTYIKGNNEKEMNLEDVKLEISQYLQVEHINFLIGSGCSSYVENGEEKAIPVMKTLNERFYNENKGFSVLDIDTETRFDNLENLLNYLNSVKIVNDKKSIEPEINKKINIVKSFIINQITNGINYDSLVKLYKSFYQRIFRDNRKTPINIFTTNYDLYNECALDDLNFLYNNGFTGTYKRKFNPMSYNYLYVQDTNLSRSTWNLLPNFINLYKLHGSITWEKSEGEIFEENYNKIKDNERVMIYPTPLKDTSTLMVPYSDLFRQFENKLFQQNSVLFILGYSFSDDHINRIIKNALCIVSMKIVIFGKSDNIDELRKLSDERIIIINSESKIHYFNNFVEKILPSPTDDQLEEEKMVNTIKNIIKLSGDTDDK